MNKPSRLNFAAICGGVLLTVALALSGCVKMDVIPSADDDAFKSFSQPRPFDSANVERERDPTQIYRIGPKDIIRIDVRQDPSISNEYEVTAEGNVLLPAAIGPVRVSDLTTAEAEQTITEILEEYIREPEVTVGVQQYLSKVVYVVGQVSQPGPQVMKADALTVEEAIFGAGLPTSEAAMHRTLIIRPDEMNPLVHEIDLSDIIYKGKLAENMILRPNDRVYVPSRYSTNLRAAIRELLGPVDDVQNVRTRTINVE